MESTLKRRDRETDTQMWMNIHALGSFAAEPCKAAGWALWECSPVVCGPA